LSLKFHGLALRFNPLVAGSASTKTLGRIAKKTYGFPEHVLSALSWWGVEVCSLTWSVVNRSGFAGGHFI